MSITVFVLFCDIIRKGKQTENALKQLQSVFEYYGMYAGIKCIWGPIVVIFLALDFYSENPLQKLCMIHS